MSDASIIPENQNAKSTQSSQMLWLDRTRKRNENARTTQDETRYRDRSSGGNMPRGASVMSGVDSRGNIPSGASPMSGVDSRSKRGVLGTGGRTSRDGGDSSDGRLVGDGDGGDGNGGPLVRDVGGGDGNDGPLVRDVGDVNWSSASSLGVTTAESARSWNVCGDGGGVGGSVIATIVVVAVVVMVEVERGYLLSAVNFGSVRTAAARAR